MILTCPSCHARLRINEKAILVTNPYIDCVRCNTKIRVDLPTEPEEIIDIYRTFVSEPTEVGWIVVHDENTQAQTLSLKPGKQTIGRYSPNKPCEVMIHSQDRYMSRQHLVVEVVKGKDGVYKYWVSDHPDCTNPTFINAYQLKRGTTLELTDGIMMQLGKTKVILKTSASVGTARKATETVLNTDFAKTVLF